MQTHTLCEPMKQKPQAVKLCLLCSHYLDGYFRLVHLSPSLLQKNPLKDETAEFWLDCQTEL